MGIIPVGSEGGCTWKEEQNPQQDYISKPYPVATFNGLEDLWKSKQLGYLDK